MSTGAIASKDVGPQTTTTQRLIEDHLGLVERIARCYQGHGLDLDDLIQEGRLGLIQAAKKFDATRGYLFSTYAPYWVRQAITLAIANQARLIRLPTSLWWGELKHLAQAQGKLWQEHGREPSLDELAASTGYERQQVVLLLQAQQEVLSLEAPFPHTNAGEEGQHLADLLEAPADPSTAGEPPTTIADVLKYLTPQEQRVVVCRFQLGQDAGHGVEDIPLPYTVVGRQLGMTRRLVVAVEARAFAKLRFWLERGNHFMTRSAEPG